MLAVSILQDRGVEVKRHVLLRPNNRTLSSGVREDIGSYLCAKPGCLFACRSPLVRQTRFRKIGCDARNGSAQFKTMDCSAVFGATGWPHGAIGPIERTNQRLGRRSMFRAPTCGSREL